MVSLRLDSMPSLNLYMQRNCIQLLSSRLNFMPSLNLHNQSPRIQMVSLRLHPCSSSTPMLVVHFSLFQKQQPIWSKSSNQRNHIQLLRLKLDPCSRSTRVLVIHFCVFQKQLVGHLYIGISVKTNCLLESDPEASHSQNTSANSSPTSVASFFQN